MVGGARQRRHIHPSYHQFQFTWYVDIRPSTNTMIPYRLAGDVTVNVSRLHTSSRFTSGATTMERVLPRGAAMMSRKLCSWKMQKKHKAPTRTHKRTRENQPGKTHQQTLKRHTRYSSTSTSTTRNDGIKPSTNNAPCAIQQLQVSKYVKSRAHDTGRKVVREAKAYRDSPRCRQQFDIIPAGTRRRDISRKNGTRVSLPHYHILTEQNRLDRGNPYRQQPTTRNDTRHSVSHPHRSCRSVATCRPLNCWTAVG